MIAYCIIQVAIHRNIVNTELVLKKGWCVSMEITDVRIRKVNDEGKMKAVVSVTFDEEFVVHDIKIIDGQNGLFVAMPSRKMGEGDFRDIAHPLISETRNKIKNAIFAEYNRILEDKADDLFNDREQKIMQS